MSVKRTASLYRGAGSWKLNRLAGLGDALRPGVNVFDEYLAELGDSRFELCRRAHKRYGGYRLLLITFLLFLTYYLR